MKKNSSIIHAFIGNHYLICIFISVAFSGCYSFTGGSVPEHLKTLSITAVNDESGFGNPTYREFLNNLIIQNFRNDASLTLTEDNGNARLSVSIVSIREEPVAVKPGELESERKVTVTCEVEFYDAIYKKTIWKKNFSNYKVYSVADLVSGRDDGIKFALQQSSDDILLAVVSGW
jgi:hypothetical protein